MQKHSNEVRELAEKTYLDTGNYIDAINKVREELGVEISERSVVRWAKKYKDIQEMSDDLGENERRQEIEKDGEPHISIVTRTKDGKKAVYEVPTSVVEKIQNMYSQNGGNMSKKAIAEELGMTYHSINTIMNAGNIYKASNVVSDIKIKELEAEGGDRKVVEYLDYKIGEGVSDKYKGVYKDKRKHHVEKEGIKAMRKLGEYEAMVEWIGEQVKEFGIPALPKSKEVERDPADFTIETIADLHLGKKETLGILNRLDEIMTVLINCEQSTIHLECLGDLGEIFIEGGRHPGQVEGMEGVYGFDLIMFVMEKLSRFINEIAQHKKVYFYGIGGNHDVFSTAKGGDQPRTAALCIYQMIKERLRNNPNIEVIIPRDEIFTYDVGGFRSIIAHGDHISRKDLNTVIVEYGSLEKYNIVKYGHLHFTHIKEGNSKGIMIGIPGLAGKGSYDKSLLLSSSTGWLEITKNPVSSKPSITTHLLD